MSELWERALDGLRDRLSLENFETWLAPVQCVGIEDETMVLKIPNRFYQDWITSHYLELIFETLAEQSGDLNDAKVPTAVRWEVDEGLQRKVQEEIEEVQSVSSTPPAAFSDLPDLPARRALLADDLKPKYSFDSFVVGPSNQLANAASVAVGEAPGKRYNPLFIYGGTGLGKTHLVNAIGHRILMDKPGARILYLSAERFTNEFIWAIRNQRIDEFRRRYRENCDVLLMDDIQFLAKRVQTQEEFFHTFNALYHKDRQIVVTSDVYPQQMAEMEERLISRFQSGMVADVQSPEIDTRVAILQKKAEFEDIPLDPEVAHYLAQVVRSNVRELEGTLIRLAVRADLLGRPIDIELAQETMRSVQPSNDTATTVEDIQKAVCTYFDLKMSDLKSKRRHRGVAFPRMLAMYLCRQRLGTSYPQLGQSFGGKDHTTVMSACKKIGGLMEGEDEKTLVALGAIERRLGR